MDYQTLRVALGVNLLAGCLLFQGCGLLNRQSSDANIASDIPDDDLGPVTVISDDSAVVRPTETVTPVETVAPVPRSAPVIPPKPRTTPYTIKKGDTISGVAYRYRLRWQDVLAINPGLEPRRLRIGQIIQLPGVVDLSKARAVKSAASSKSSAKVKPPKVTAPNVSTPDLNAPGKTYIVKKGDVLSIIAQKNGIKTSALMAANNLKSDRIIVGQKLKIPGSSKNVSSSESKSAAPKLPPPPVNTGETTKKVVESAPVTLDSAGESPDQQPAKELTESVPETVVEEAAVEPAPENLQTYTVKEGEDVYAVAIRWGVSPKEITSLNNLSSIELEPGTVLKIPSVK